MNSKSSELITSTAAAEAIFGRFDGIEKGAAFGWALAPRALQRKLGIELLDGNTVVASGVAERLHLELSSKGVGDGRYAFAITLPASLADGKLHSLRARVAQTDVWLHGTHDFFAGSESAGAIEGVQGVEVVGWVVCVDPAVKAARVEVLVDGELIGTALANLARPDLLSLPLARRHCGFRLAVPPRFYDGREHVLGARVVGKDLVLRGNGWPFRIQLAYNIDICDIGRVAGWITNQWAPQAPVRMDVWLDDALQGVYSAGLVRSDVAAKLKLPANAAGTGFDLALPAVLWPGQVRRIKLCPPGRPETLTGRELLLIERFELIRQAEQFAALVRGGQGTAGQHCAPELLTLLMPQWLQMLRQRYATGKTLHWERPQEPPAALPGAELPTVDVIVPVYKGRRQTLACIESVLRARAGSNMELVVINDASPDEQLTAALRQMAAAEGFTLLENDSNLGFVATVNRGMRLHGGRDVVLLNSDTLVAPGWLARLQAAACSEANIGTATPLSNRATILSIPEPQVDNDMPARMDVAELDTLCSELNAGVRVDIPTAIGFCMYIKREVLRTIGLFDEARWGKGYAEENDFCVKASGLGWRHVAACDVFVQHHGSVSFAGDKTERLQQNLAKLYALYPDYPERVQAFIAADPLRAVRARINLRLLRRTAPCFVLHVMHGWGGGVEVAVRDLCARLSQAKEGALILSANANGSLLLSLPGGGLPISYAPGTSMAAVCKNLRTLGVWHVHIHQTVGLPKEVWQIATALKAAYDFTVHDYFSVCPRVNFVDAGGAFCGQAEVSVCEQCVSAETLDAQTRALFVALGGTVEAWRKFHLGKLKKARAIFAPSEDAVQRIGHYTKLPQLRYQPHPEGDIEFSPRKRAPKGVLRVAVIGAIGAHKGHRLLLATAAYAQRKKLAIEFVVVGYTCEDAAYAALNNVKIMGAYKPEELAGLLADSGCTVALFLSIWPETFSYTLSEAWRAGLVPVVTDLGAQAERVKREKIGIVLSPASKPEDVVAVCMKAGTGTRPKKKTIAGAAYEPLLPGYYALKAPGKVRKAMK